MLYNNLLIYVSFLILILSLFLFFIDVTKPQVIKYYIITGITLLIITVLFYPWLRYSLRFLLLNWFFDTIQL